MWSATLLGVEPAKVNSQKMLVMKHHRVGSIFVPKIAASDL